MEDQLSRKSIDLHEAWKSKRYDLILISLQNDLEFPENFDLKILKDETEIQKRLIAFVQQRNQLHQLIEEGDFQQLGRIIDNVKSKTYLSSENKSALYTAIKCKRFQTYAFLKSIGAEFKDKTEKNVLDELTFSEKQTVKEQLIRYFPKSPQAHIHYLVSKSRSSKPAPEFDEKVKTFYEILNQIPEVSIILQVIQHSKDLDVVFDFDNENITDLCPHASKNTRGQTNYKEERLYIAAGQDGESKMLGTLAHELMHMAMEIIYKNDCNPYFKFRKENETKFNRIVQFIGSKFQNVSDEKSKVIRDGFHSYEQPDHNSELIARIPHIFVQFLDGREWLDNEAKVLMDYFNTVVLEECQNFIDQSYLLKPKNQIRKINEQLGELKNIQKSSVSFRNVELIHDFINNKKEDVMLIKGKSPWITLLRTLQGICGEDYKNLYSNFIVVKFDNYVKEANNILETFIDASDSLIIYYCHNSQIRINTQSQEEGIKWFWKKSNKLHHKQDKKVIFVIHNDIESETKRLLKKFHLSCACISDENITLDDLDDDSQNIVLNKSIYFQGKKTSLTKMFRNKNQIKSLIDAETIAELILEDKTEVGNKSLGLAGLDGAYADMQEDVNIDILTHELTNPESKIFVFEEIGDHSVPTNVKKNINFEKIEKLLADHSDTKYLKIVQDGYSNDEFKQLCQDNPDKDIYWIQDIKNQERRLILRKLYTPQFYIGRNFMLHKKITIKIKEIEELSKYEGTKCLISNTNADEFLDFYRDEILEKRNKNINLKKMETKIIIRSTSLRKNKKDETETSNNEKGKLVKELDISRIIFVENETEGRTRFKELSASGDTIYWLEKIENNLLYKQSQGPLTNLKKHINKENSEKSIVLESDFAKNIKNRKAFVTSDDPGMGKSTTLANLCNSELSKTYWIIKIHLKYIPKDLKKINDIKNLVALLCKTNDDLNNNLAKLMLQAALDQKYDFFKPILIVFDGFDEVLDDNYREKIISLLKFINEKTKGALFVTTRCHLKEVLEDTLSTFAFEFQPMDNKTKTEFVMRYFKIRFNLILNAELFQENQFLLYSEKFVSEVEKAFNADKIRFVGTPLQMYLMLEHITSNFKNWARNENHDDPITFDLGKDILEVYSNFIEKKFQYFCNRNNRNMTISPHDIITLCEKLHMKLAKTLTFNFKSEVPLEDFKDMGSSFALACGIVKSENNRLKFIHPTFQEYYAAKLYIAWFEKKDQKQDNLKNIFYSIFVDDSYQVIRHFLECKIQYDKVPPDNIENSTKILVTALQERRNNNLTFLDVAVREEHVNIFNFVLKILLRDKTMNLLNIKCRFGDSLLTYACRCNKRKILESVFKICECSLNVTQVWELLRLRGHSKETCLHHAALHNNTEIIKIILEKIKDCSEIEFYNFIKLKDDYDNTPLHSAASFAAPLFALANTSYAHLTEAKSLIRDFYFNNESKSFSYPELPYSLFNRQKDIYKFYVNNHLSRMISNWKQEAKFSAISTFKTILEYFSENETEIFKILQSKNLNGSNGIHCIIYIGDIDLIRFVLDKTETLNVSRRDMYDFLFSCTGEGYNILDISCSKGDVSIINMVFDLIKKFGGDIQYFLLHGVSDSSNGLHLAITNKHIEAAELLVQKAKELSMGFQYKYLTSLNQQKDTPLHCAMVAKQRYIVEFILENIPSERLYYFVGLQNFEKENALHLGAYFGSADCVKSILYKLKETISTNNFQNMLLPKDELDWNAFHLSAQEGHLDVLLILLQYATELSPEFKYTCLTSLNQHKRTPFHSAMLKKQHSVVKFILENIPSERLYDLVDFRDLQNANALHSCAFFGSADYVELILNMLKQTISTNNFQNFLLSKNQSHNNAFHYSALEGHLDVLSILLQYATELSPEFKYTCLTSLNQQKFTPLFMAVVEKQRHVVEFILKNISSERLFDFVDFRDNENDNALHLGALAGSADCVESILNKLKETISTNDFKNFLQSKGHLGYNAFHFSSQGGHLDVLSILLQYATEASPEFKYKCLTSLNQQKRTPLHTAVEKKHHNVVKFILENIPSERLYDFVEFRDFQNDNALHLGAYFGIADCVKSILYKLKETISSNNFQNFLLSKNVLDYNAFYYSAQEGHLDVLSILLQYATELSLEFKYKCLTSLNQQKRTPLHTAMVAKQRDVVIFILENIPLERLYNFVDFRDLKNDNALHLGAYFGSADCVKSILYKLKEKISTNNFQNFLLSKNALDCNAIHISVESGHLNVLSVLLQFATELSPEFQYKCVTSLNKKERTALHTAVIKKQHNVVKIILKNIPLKMIYEFVNLSDNKNENALHLGAYYNSTESVKSILSKLKKTISTNSLQTFLQSKGQLDYDAFHYSAQEGHLDVLSILLQYATELSLEFKYKCLTSLNQQKRTPLHTAMVAKQRNVVEFILENIPLERLYDFVDFRDFKNENALHLGAYFGSANCVDSILNKLKETISTNDFQNFLLSKNVLDCNALHISVEIGHLNVLSVLLQFATKLSEEFQWNYFTSLNKDKRTALDIAMINNHRNVAVSILQKTLSRLKK